MMSPTFRTSLTLSVLTATLWFGVPFVNSSAAVSRHAVEFTNDSGQQVVLDWYNPVTGENIEFHNLAEGETISVNSFTNHTFLLRFNNDTTCAEECLSTTVTITNQDDQGKKLIQAFRNPLTNSSSVSSRLYLARTEVNTS